MSNLKTVSGKQNKSKENRLSKYEPIKPYSKTQLKQIQLAQQQFHKEEQEVFSKMIEFSAKHSSVINGATVLMVDGVWRMHFNYDIGFHNGSYFANTLKSGSLK